MQSSSPFAIRHSPFAILRTILAAVVLGPVLMTGCFVALNVFTILESHDKDVALARTREWARVAEFPVPDSEIDVKVTANFFNSWIKVEFEAPIATIDAWLKSSEGIADARVTEEETEEGTRIIRYAISPDGGAQFAEVIVDRNKGLVRIHASCC